MQFNLTSENETQILGFELSATDVLEYVSDIGERSERKKMAFTNISDY